MKHWDPPNHKTQLPLADQATHMIRTLGYRGLRTAAAPGTGLRFPPFPLLPLLVWLWSLPLLPLKTASGLCASSIVVNLVCSSLADTVESDATYQRKLRKLRQKQMQQQFRERMETRQQGLTPAEVEAKPEVVLPAPPKYSTLGTAASGLASGKAVFPDNLEDNLEVWDLTPDLEDIIKPSSRPEPPQASATRTLNNQVVIPDGVLHGLCHQEQEKPGPGYLQTCSTNQHELGNSESHRKSQDLKKRKLDPS